MLARTFLFLPGIGPVREQRLWRRGVESWDAYLGETRVQGIKPRLKAVHDRILEEAQGAITDDPSFFARLLPSAEGWRAYDTFGAGAAYVDIETTGDRANHVTVVGVRRGGVNRAFVRGIDYTPDAVSQALAGATMLVTFNGASFDLPVLASEGVQLPVVPHADLRLVCARVGYTGGLKKIEETVGLARPDDVKGLTGWDAVKLWRRWSAKRDEEALRTLVAYNVSDFENLERLAELACVRLARETVAQVNGQARLTVAEAPAGP